MPESAKDESEQIFRRELEQQHKGIPDTSLNKTVSLGTQCKCLKINACSMGNQHVELEVKSQQYDIFGLNTLWWNGLEWCLVTVFSGEIDKEWEEVG